LLKAQNFDTSVDGLAMNDDFYKISQLIEAAKDGNK